MDRLAEYKINIKKKEYEIIATCFWNNKNYVVYTDHTYDEKGKLKVYGGILVNKRVQEISNDADDAVIKDMLKELLDTLKAK